MLCGDCLSDRFYSMSAQIEAERKIYYYQPLERQQRNSVDITGWLDWFLDCLGRAIATAEKTLSAVLYKAELWKIANRCGVSERQRLIQPCY